MTSTDLAAFPQTFVGKVALVTGGARGIGAAIVRRLAGAGPPSPSPIRPRNPRPPRSWPR